MTREGGGPALPTLRCPDCGHADLLFRSTGEVRCGHCMKRWKREELVRTQGSAGKSYDHKLKEAEEG